jgi:hypothetical protein
MMVLHFSVILKSLTLAGKYIIIIFTVIFFRKQSVIVRIRFSKPSILTLSIIPMLLLKFSGEL